MDATELTCKLVDINSDSNLKNEIDVSRFIDEYLQSIGIKSEITKFEDGRANVVAEIGEGEGLMLNGHIDTVPIGNPKEWKYGIKSKIHDGKIYGRGTSDMKGGVASMLAALNKFKFNKAKRKLILAFVADEEIASKGSSWLLENRKELFDGTKYGIISEPTDLNIQIAQKGQVGMKVKFFGKPAHASRPELGKNAIVDAAKFINELEGSMDKIVEKDKILGKGTINIGTIQGGTAGNVVPDYCELHIDRRVVSKKEKETSVRQMEDIIKDLGLNAEVESLIQLNPFAVNEDSRIVNMLRKISQSGNSVSPGYTESELYNRKAGIECVVFGPGTKSVIHRYNEYVTISNLNRAAEIFEEVIRQWCFS